MKIGRNLKYIGKYIDQPLVLAKINKAVPPVLIGGASAYALHDAYNNHKGESKKNLIKNASTLTFTVIGALVGLRGLKIGSKQIIKKFIHVNPAKKIKETNKKLIENFLKKNENLDKEIVNMLEKAINKPLKKSEIIKFEEEFLKNQPRAKKAVHSCSHNHHHHNEPKTLRELFDNLFPPPEDIDLKHAKKHVASLSWLGLLPVVGGVLGGVIGDKLAEKENWKKGVPNKIKEGSYQYLANIFLCNLGALGVIWGLDKLQNKNIIKKPHPLVKAGAILTGVMTAGVIGGSFLANLFGQRVLNPLLGEKPQKNKSIYHERVPEALDIALHVDDIATVGVLSGLKWIEPALPLMYAISGYRAGMGYRNHHVKNHFHRGKHQHNQNRDVYLRHLRENPAFISFNSSSLKNKG